MPSIVIHHKANTDAHTNAPNSLEAIHASLEANAACIEIDIMALADEDFLLVHDDQLQAETTGSGSISACSAEIARGLYFKAYEGRFRVPLLSEVVALLKAHGGTTRLQLDFKDVYPYPTDEPLHRLLRLIEPLGNRVIVSSAADWQLRKLRRLSKTLDLGFDPKFYLDWRAEKSDPRLPPFRLSAYGYYDDHLLSLEKRWSSSEYLADRCEMLARLVDGVSVIYINYGLLTHSLDDGFNWAAALHEMGIQVAAWTLDADNAVAVESLSALTTAGVDQFTSNTPLALGALLKVV